MIDRHAVHALLRSGLSTKDTALQMGVSHRTIQRIVHEPAVQETDDRRARRARQVGRPAVPDAVPLAARRGPRGAAARGATPAPRGGRALRAFGVLARRAPCLG
jgi:hypothetical protein